MSSLFLSRLRMKTPWQAHRCAAPPPLPSRLPAPPIMSAAARRVHARCLLSRRRGGGGGGGPPIRSTVRSAAVVWGACCWRRRRWGCRHGPVRAGRERLLCCVRARRSSVHELGGPRHGERAGGGAWLCDLDALSASLPRVACARRLATAAQDTARVRGDRVPVVCACRCRAGPRCDGCPVLLLDPCRCVWPAVRCSPTCCLRACVPACLLRLASARGLALGVLCNTLVWWLEARSPTLQPIA
eukprot:COSAG01_NODE_2683_length_7256_cov_28.923432_4_plen_243_part_00